MTKQSEVFKRQHSDRYSLFLGSVDVRADTWSFDLVIRNEVQNGQIQENQQSLSQANKPLCGPGGSQISVIVLAKVLHTKHECTVQEDLNIVSDLHILHH